MFHTRFLQSICCLLTLLVSTICFQITPTKNIIRKKPFSSTALNGKLWDKLQIEPDPLDEEAGWYLMNCIVGSEMDLLGQAKHVTKDLPFELVEKLVVPTERKLRSHGKKHNVVEVKVMYPGYVFCKMRICAETYEPLQQLPLCRSWMAGTVNQKGYKKLPPAPIALSDEEVSKFKGLEEQTEAMYDKYGEDYTGKGDDGMDLIHQYEGYRVGNMVKILDGNFKGEDGEVRRLKDEMIMVRLYTYGTVLDQWFSPKDIRPMTDAEAMKGLTGPSAPINQDEFDHSIGKEPKNRDLGGRGTPRSKMLGLGGGEGTRMRRQDRISRGERGNSDLYGRSKQQVREEEENWRQFREEQRASQQQKRGDLWGIKERSSWDSGDDAAQYTDNGWKSGRQIRKERKSKESGAESKSFQDAIDGGEDWDFFASTSNAQEEDGDTKQEDDFFASLMTELSDSMVEVEDDFMSELSDSLDGHNGSKGNGRQTVSGATQASSDDGSTADDDFFNDLMTNLSETLDDSPQSGKEVSDSSRSFEQPQSKSSKKEDDFFNDLMSQLSDSSDEGLFESRSDGSDDDDDDRNTKRSDDDFFASLEADLNESLMESSDVNDGIHNSDHQQVHFEDFDENIEHDSHRKQKKQSETTHNLQVVTESDLSKNTVASLKEMLKERGLKVSGKKAELISRLLEN